MEVTSTVDIEVPAVELESKQYLIKMSSKNYYQSGIKCHKNLRSSGDNSGHKYSIKMANVPHSLPVRRGVGCSISQFFDEVCNTAEPHRKLLEQQYHFKKSRMCNEAITTHSTKKRNN